MSEDADLGDETVAAMVRHLQPSWRVQSVTPSEFGTDSVVHLAVETPEGPDRAVLKATTADHVDPETARAEPRVFALLDSETEIPVPEVYGYCDDHAALPSPFYLMSHVEGENFEGRPHDLPPAARERTLRDAGRYLAQLHELDTFSRVAPVGVRDGDLALLDTDDPDAFHDWLLAAYEDTLDSLADGGYFPDLADDRERFADVVPEVGTYLRETIPDLPDPDSPTYCNKDYRYGNLLLDPETGATRAVLDWGLLVVAPPAFNLASTESLVLTPDEDDAERTAELREAFRSAYAAGRETWTLDAETCERLRVYRLCCRLDAMACLPLWLEDASPADRDARAAEHRAFLAQYL